MIKNNILSSLLLAGGEVIIILCFLYFGRNSDSSILVLNIAVSSIIYFILFIDTVSPLVIFKNKSQGYVGSMGIKWFFTFFYILFAILIMLAFNLIFQINIVSQLLVHSILFFLLLLGFYFGFSSSQNVNAVLMEENQSRMLLEEMKKNTKEVVAKLEKMKNMPPEVLFRMRTLLESLRFISPSNSIEASNHESSYLAEIVKLQNCLIDISPNIDSILICIENCEYHYKGRKQVYSN